MRRAGGRSCASSPACADVVIGHVCLDVMFYESARGAGLLLRAALACQLPSWALPGDTEEDHGERGEEVMRDRHDSQPRAKPLKTRQGADQQHQSSAGSAE